MLPTNEPVAIGAGIQGLVAAVLATLTAFNVWKPTDAQTAAVFGLYAALTVVVGYFVRGKVSGPKTSA